MFKTGEKVKAIQIVRFPSETYEPETRRAAIKFVCNYQTAVAISPFFPDGLIMAFRDEKTARKAMYDIAEYGCAVEARIYDAVIDEDGITLKEE